MASNQFIGLSFPSTSAAPSIHSLHLKSPPTSPTNLKPSSNTTFLELNVCSLAKMYQQQPPKQSRLKHITGNYP